MSESNKILAIVLVLIALLIFSPVITIWSLNTLFGLAIPYTLATWFATVWLSMVTFGNVVTAVNKKRK